MIRQTKQKKKVEGYDAKNEVPPKGSISNLDELVNKCQLFKTIPRSRLTNFKPRPRAACDA